MKFLQQIIRPLLGIFFGITLLLTSFFGNSVIMLILPMLLLNHQQWRLLIDRAISFWIIIPVTFLEYIFGMKFKVIGDTIDYDRPALIIMNHRTRLDWMYFWAALFKMNPWLLISSKIALKAELRHIPAAGFGMEANQFIFLDRKIKTDKERISEAIRYYASVGSNYQILLFPEGTDKTPSTTIKSNNYARKNGLKQLNNLIYPRSAGFIHLINEMKQYNYIDCIYDVTIAYPVNIVQSEINLILTGRTPQKVLFHIERIDLSCLPLKDDDIAQWINELWIAKDEKLDSFYSQQPPRIHFPNDNNKFIWEDDNSLQKIVKLFTLCFWLLLITLWFYHLTFLRFVQVLFAYFIFAYVYVHSKYGGIQQMVYIKWWHTMKSKIPHW
uniref:Phospholipid/glycerol acyltransferase domain-containing protein n=2 Tax=Wuchereria bancrofti TaxID=6293 RepID=A0AAF5Q422_WUCBA